METNSNSEDNDLASEKIKYVERRLEKGEEFRQDLLRLINVIRSCKASAVFVTDKSTRPYAWAVQDVWSELQQRRFFNEDENLPQFRFIDIGRAQNESRLNDESSAMKQARKYKVPSTGSILVIDDYSFSGSTLRETKKVVDRLFPKRDIFAHAVSGSEPPWFEMNVTGLSDAVDGEIWASRNDTETSREFRHLIREKLARPVSRKILNGEFKLTPRLPEPYSDPTFRSRIQDQLDQENIEKLEQLGMIKQVKYGNTMLRYEFVQTSIPKK